MQITALGANKGTVTGSSYHLTSNSGESILIDLGMYQGSPELQELNQLPLDCDCSKLIGVVLTHAHLDHCGRLPILLHQGFTQKIYMTPPTKDLAELVLLDSAHIAAEDKTHVPIYTKEDVERLFNMVHTVDYESPLILGDFTITFNDAGHILGSATLEIVDESSPEKKKIVFSGDLGNSPQDIVRPTEVITSADVVVMESTYGDRLHTGIPPIETIQSEINAIETDGGTLLIPAFSLERSQELLHHIGHLKRTGKIKAETPVYLDGPMAEKATLIYEKYPEYYNREFTHDLETIGNPMEFEGLVAVQSGRQSQAVSGNPETKVIIAGSGMMSGGRIMNHAIRYLPLASTRVLIVGYQADGTVGRQILDGAKYVDIYDKSVQVNAHITDTQAMSSHADQAQLLKWLSTISGVKQVILSHGEDGPRQALAAKITEQFGITDIILP